MSSPQVHLNEHHAPVAAPADGGKLIVITAPLTESIDHAGYFIQMGMASMPIWMEGVLNSKYPQCRSGVAARIQRGRHRLLLPG
jgi:hypothetical protein